MRCHRALSPLKKILFLKCCTLSPYTYASLQPSSKSLFFAPSPLPFVYLQVSLQPATMPVRHAKRQPDTDPTSVPSASGISGSQTAPCPTGTSLLSDTDSGTSYTDLPDFAPGFVSVYLILDHHSNGPLFVGAVLSSLPRSPAPVHSL